MKKKMLTVFIAFWLVVVSVPLIYFHSFHYIPLPEDNLNTNSLTELLSDSSKTSDSWQAIHFLTASCLCSNELATYLHKRGPIDNERLEETIVIVGENTELFSSLEDKGFFVKSISENDLGEKYQITGIPLLVYLDPRGVMQYSGGYADRNINISTMFKDKEIFQRMIAGKETNSLPKFGCAVAKDLQQRLDPMKLKYGVN